MLDWNTARIIGHRGKLDEVRQQQEQAITIRITKNEQKLSPSKEREFEGEINS
jgi:hypothetical protein